MNGAGKGSDYRIVDKEKFNDSYDRIFGKKDVMDFHKDKEDNAEANNNAGVAQW